MKKQKNQPLVSIIIPVYNAERYLRQALSSVLSQSYRNIEIIVVDDKSTDNSYKMLRQFRKQDKRVRMFRLTKHSGVGTAANYAIIKSRGKYIARMDADDEMMQDRIEKQVNYLKDNPDVVGVGGQCERIDGNGRYLGIKRFPLDHKQIKSMVFRSIPLQQPTLMIQKDRLPKDFEWYNTTLPIGEDYELYYKLMRYGKLANIPDIILQYREHTAGVSFVSQRYTFWCIWKARILGIVKHGYIPDIVSSLNVVVQTIIVLILPEQILYPLHMKTRQFFFKHQLER